MVGRKRSCPILLTIGRISKNLTLSQTTGIACSDTEESVEAFARVGSTQRATGSAKWFLGLCIVKENCSYILWSKSRPGL